MSTMGDGGLAERVLQGDEAAFAELMRRYDGVVREQVAVAGLNWADVEDLAQDVWLDAFRRMRRFDAAKSFGSWIREICRDRVKKHFRSEGREQVRWVSLADPGVEREAERRPVQEAGREGGKG